ncbi:MAG: hypothetical protein H6713_06790 [Myxococcales bacterium]|nr:hypothetical protein [Myxococcales bacterium]MCB9749699.1 hypothetical protein [Myxococcales bacterium]
MSTPRIDCIVHDHVASRLGLGLILCVALASACGDDLGGTVSDADATLTPTQPTVNPATSAGSETGDTSAGPGGTDSETGASTEPLTGVGPTSATESTGTTGETITASDPFATTSGTSTGDPGVLHCSGDLHDVLDENDQVYESCTPDEACLDGACMPVCEVFGAQQGTVGCDFWAPTPPFYLNGQNNTYQGPCYAVFVANAWTGPAQLSVSRGGQQLDVSSFGRIPKSNGGNITYEPIPPEGLPPDEVAILFLSHKPGAVHGLGYSLECPVSPAVLADTAVPNSGIGQAFHVASDSPLSAYDINPYGGATSFLPSASLLFPATSWGDNYMAIAPAQSSQGRWALVVAREDNTLIKVAPKSGFPGGGGVAPAPANVTTEYMLNAGEILQWSQSNNQFDPNSAVFESDKPIGLWTGDKYLFVASATSQGPGGGESAHQQIAPVAAVGNEYVGAGVVTRLANLAPESVPYRMVGAVDGTQLTWDPGPPPGAPASLQAGEVAQFETTIAFTVRSQDPDFPFLFSQYMPGTWSGTRPDCTANIQNIQCGLGDEEWVSLLSPKQFQNRYVFFTDPTYGTTTLVIIRAQGENGFEDVEIECLGTVGGWTPVGNDGVYEYAHVDLERGNTPVGQCGTSRHLAESDGPFGIIVWGTDTYASYGYPAGSDISKINEVILPVPE